MYRILRSCAAAASCVVVPWASGHEYDSLQRGLVWHTATMAAIQRTRPELQYVHAQTFYDHVKTDRCLIWGRATYKSINEAGLTELNPDDLDEIPMNEWLGLLLKEDGRIRPSLSDEFRSPKWQKLLDDDYRALASSQLVYADRALHRVSTAIKTDTRAANALGTVCGVACVVYTLPRILGVAVASSVLGTLALCHRHVFPLRPGVSTWCDHGRVALAGTNYEPLPAMHT